MVVQRSFIKEDSFVYRLYIQNICSAEANSGLVKIINTHCQFSGF
jgi:hypothetical protein